MAENSLRYAAFEDQNAKEWARDISNGYVGSGVKAELMVQWRKEFEKFCEWVILEFVDEDVDDEDEEDDL